MPLSDMKLYWLLSALVCMVASQNDQIVPETQFEITELVQSDETVDNPSSVAHSINKLHEGALNQRQTADAERVSKLAKAVELLASAPAPTPTDGGSAALAARVTTAKQALKDAVAAMASGMDSDYVQGKTDLVTLKGAINEAVQDITTDEQNRLRFSAHDSCVSARASEAAGAVHTNAKSDRDTYNPVIPDSLAYFKKLGSITACNRDSASSTCPNPAVSLASDLMAKFQEVTQAYYNKDIALQAAETAKQNAEGWASANLTTTRTAVQTVVVDLVNFCKADGDIYNIAVDSFNTNNVHRGSMLRTLRELVCTIDHIDNRDGTAIAVNDPASGAAATATSESACKTASKTKQTLQTERFADATKEAFTCPTKTTYVNKVKAVYDMQLTDTWIASVSNCASVPAPTTAPTTAAPTTAPTTAAPTTAAPTTEAPTTAAPTTEAPTTAAPSATCSIQAPTDFTDTSGWTVDGNPVTTCGWMAHICQKMQECKCYEQGGDQKCQYAYLQEKHGLPAKNCGICRGFKIPDTGTGWSHFHSDAATQVWTGNWICPAGTGNCNWPTGKH